MKITVIGPVGHREDGAVDTQGRTLGYLLGKHAEDFEQIRINGKICWDWQSFAPGKTDHVEIISRTGLWAIPALISLAISLAISGITYALTPKPKKPKLDSPIEAFGIAGFTNTTGRGTPAFVPYGINRIFGHVISSGATVSSDGKQMFGKVLYFMGDCGGDGLNNIYDIEIDKTSISQIPEIQIHMRTGTNAQPVIPEFENDDDLFSDGRTINFDPEALPGTPLIYTCKASVHRVTLFFNFVGGLYRVSDKGKTRQAGVRYSIEIAASGSGSWSSLPNAGWFEQVKGGLFKTYEITFPHQGIWDIRITAVFADGYESDGQFVADAILFNVQETVFTNRRYPQWALLGLVNIPSKKIRSLEQMACSALVDGKRVKVPNAFGGHDLVSTRQRCWIVRDMMTHPIVGMGSEIDESEIDDDQWRTEAQDYYDELVPGLPGQPMERRDLCDYVVTQSDWDWEHIKKVCGEARGRIIPSGDKWKYVVDKPGTPNLLYAEGANIIEGSTTLEISRPDKPFSEITAQFRDAEQDFENNFSPPIVDPEAISPVQELLQYDTLTRESQVQRENLIVFKRAFLERRRWSFNSPANAIVSEPLDLDYLAERAIGNEGSYSGFLPPGSSLSNVILPDIVTLEAGSGYALIIKHRGDNTTEYRAVTTAAGVWGQVAVSAPFVQAPTEGDIFSLGIENVEHIITRAAELEIDGEGHVRQVRVEYIPDIYTQDELPPKSARRRFALGDNRPPIPLRDAQVSEEVAMNRDGSVRSILIFDVTPGLHKSGGVFRLSLGFTDRVAVDDTEPPFNDYYNGAKISIIANTGAGQVSKVYDYDGPNRVAFFSPDMPVSPDATSNYTMEFERFGEFAGFKVEISEDERNATDPVGFPDGVNFSNLATSYDTHWEMDGRGAGPGLVFFRFTPISRSGTENVLARIIRQLQVQGDLSAPDPPSYVAITSYLLSVEVRVSLLRPVAEDFSGVEIEIWRNEIGGGSGVLLDVVRFGASYDSKPTGEMVILGTINLGVPRGVLPPETYGTVIHARVRAKDYSDNPKFDNPLYHALAVNSQPGGTTLTPDPLSAGLPGEGPPAIPTGLTLSTGLQIDPTDGQLKPFLDISWNANVEPDMDRYEVQYRPVSITPGPPTTRMVQHPQISIREVGVLGGTFYEAQIQAIDRSNLKSGFTGWITQIQTLRDQTPPAAPVMFSFIGGFKMISMFISLPPDQDRAGIEVWLSTINDLLVQPPAHIHGTTGPADIQFIAGQLENDTSYYIWLRAIDRSGNYSAFDKGRFDGTHIRTLLIGPNDLIVDNVVVTNTAQIANGIITDLHVSNVSANKLTAGTINAQLMVANDRLYIDGINRQFWVRDDNLIPRAVMGKVGITFNDWGLEIYGPDGSRWHSLTAGTLTAGRQDVNEVTLFVSASGSGAADSAQFAGVFVTSNTTTQISIRVSIAWQNRPGLKAGLNDSGVGSAEYTITHNAGKKMIVTCGLTGIVEGSPPITAGLVVHYW